MTCPSEHICHSERSEDPSLKFIR